jgi:type IV secretory pathway TrbD component
MTVREVPAEYCAPVRESPNRPHLWMGCESPIVMISGIVALIWTVSVFNFFGVVIGIGILAAGISVGRSIAQVDPYYIRIWMDGKNWQQGFWPSHSAPPRVADFPVTLPVRKRLWKALQNSTHVYR